MPNFANAFKCKKCPESNTEKGCPCWTELTMVNDDGNHKIEKACIFGMLPMLLVEVIKATNVTTGEINNTKNEMVKGFSFMSEVFSNIKQINQGSKKYLEEKFK